ncbi:MAG TPA: DUF4910 domain-containing protein, partial [candidate division Zixibacteria bacterium]|nr:DUF4910 domain-containing protein [candidate division Zixibacteria bacterium]
MIHNEFIKSIVERLYPFSYGINRSGNDDAIEKFMHELDFVVHEYEDGEELNGWSIPENEKVTKAEIRLDGKLIYDGLSSPLGTIMACTGFTGKVSLFELKEHLYFKDSDPDAIVFNCMQFYRPAKNTWGFCIQKKIFDALKEGEYEIDIRVERDPRKMRVLDYTLPGESDETIIIQAHNCHPYQANDDISGCACGIEMIKRLMNIKHRRYTYRLIICPELTGTMFWLDAHNHLADKFISAIILAAVGNDSELKVQYSFTGNALVDDSARHVFDCKYGNYISGPFRTIYGNDETVFESPGFSIPSISLTRYPFPEYHSNKDTPDIVKEDMLQDTVDTGLQICQVMEMNVSYKFIKKGLFCLSHPKYNLYKMAWDPS